MITLIEKCIKKVGSRFDLVVLSSYRVKEIMNGAQPLTSNSSENDGEYTITLREVLEDKIDMEKLKACIVNEYKYASTLSQHKNSTNSKGGKRIFRDSSDEEAIRDLFSIIADEEHEKSDQNIDETEMHYDSSTVDEAGYVEVAGNQLEQVDDETAYLNELEEESDKDLLNLHKEEKGENTKKKKYAGQGRRNKTEPDLSKIGALKYVDTDEEDI